MADAPTANGTALAGVRVLDLTSGIAGPIAGMLLADFGADVVKVELPAGDPGRLRPGFTMWNRGKRSVRIDPTQSNDRARLAELLAGTDICISDPVGASATPLRNAADLDSARQTNPALIQLDLPAFLGDARWAGGDESIALVTGLAGMSLRQNSYHGTPVDPAFPYALYIHGIWAAATAMAALLERERSGHGQVVTVGGMHAQMITSTMSLLFDPDAQELPADNGPGGPNALYTRYRCADDAWLFVAALTPKFQHQTIDVLGLSDVLADSRIAGDLEALLRPENRAWVRQRFAAIFAQRSSTEWRAILHAADVPVGVLGQRDDWLDAGPVTTIGMRVEVEDPDRGRVVMPGNPINLLATPAVTNRPAPQLGADDGVDWSPRAQPTGAPSEGGTALAGLRVLDLGAVLAGPYTGTLLAELGADVIKVEVPAGDSWRDRGMTFIRGQRGLGIDLRSTGGRDAFLDLVRSADVVVDNYRAGVLGRLGIDYDRLRLVKPDLVMLSMTGFGPDGPYAAEPAFDPLLQALSGMMTAQGGDSDPVMLGVPVNDVTTAALAVFGVLVGIRHRNRTGTGQSGWIALAGAAAFAQCEELIRYADRVPALVGGRDYPGPSALDRSYAVQDGWIRLHASPTDLPALNASGLLEADQRDADQADADPAVDEVLIERLAKAFAARSRAEVVSQLTAAGVRVVPVRRLAELPNDPEFRRAQIFHTLDRPSLDPLLGPGRYARFSRTQVHTVLQAPGVGEHSRELLTEVGYSAEHVDALIANGAIRQGEPMVYRVFASYR